MTTSESTEHQNIDTKSQSNDDSLKKPKLIDTNYMFSSVFSPVYVFAQQNQPPSFDKLANLMTQLIKNHLMSIAFLNEQSMKLMHMDWNQVFR